MKVANNNRNRYSPYKTGDDINNCFSYTEILQNIRALHGNVENDQKSNILSIVSYDTVNLLIMPHLLIVPHPPFLAGSYQLKVGH